MHRATRPDQADLHLSDSSDSSVAHHLTPLQFRAGPTRVLLVDDQAIVIAGMHRLLGGETDIVLHAVQDPLTALQQALAFRPTVILQDLVMPGVDGFDVVASFRRHPDLRTVPVVVLSSTEDASVKARAFASGANDYLIKLPAREELLARLRYHSAAYNHHLERDLVLGQLSRELDMARSMLLGLLPEPGMHGSARFEWVFHASSYVSGDCFDYFPLNEDYLCFYVADVAGHGVSAAMLAFSVQHQIRAADRSVATLIARHQGNLEAAAVEAVEGINRRFMAMRETSLYLTIVYGLLNHRTGEVALVQAGHPPAFCFPSRGGEIHAIGHGSVPIGFLPEPGYEAHSLTLTPGARLYLYSDGVTECLNTSEESFGLDRLKTVLERCQNQPLRCADANVQEALHAWQGGSGMFDDDVTFLAIELRP